MPAIRLSLGAESIPSTLILQNHPGGGRRSLLIGSPRAAGLASHLRKLALDLHERKFQFRFGRCLQTSLVKPSIRQIVCCGSHFKYLPEQHPFSRVCSDMSASDLFEVPIPCSDYPDATDGRAFSLYLTNQPA